MSPNPHVISEFKKEFYNWKLWIGRALILGFAAIAGLTVVAFTWLTEFAFSFFSIFEKSVWWMPLIWTPLCTAGIVYVTRRFFAGAAGSGIPQVMASLSTNAPHLITHYFVSLKLSISKMLLTAFGLLGGLSLGREGPSVQIAAGVMHSAQRFLPEGSVIKGHNLLLAGGAAGIAAAFNTPLGGIMFAIEELSRRPEQKNNGLTIAAIVLSGLMAVSIYGNATYFGVIKIENLTMALLLPGLLVAICCGLLGGLFSRLLVISLSGLSNDWFSKMRHQAPVIFAAVCGFAVALIGVVTHGDIFGSGYEHTKSMLEGHSEPLSLYVLLKFVATWLTTWAGVPGGIFAPSLSIGGALGNDIALITSYINPPTLIALGMAGFLAAVTQAPMTSFIIVMEMVTGHELVLSLMATALIANGISRLISTPLYAALTDIQLQRLPIEDKDLSSDKENGEKKGAPKGSELS